MPRGRGEGGNLLRAHRFKLRHSRTTLYIFTTSLQRETDLWRLLQKECLLQRWPACGNRQLHKAKGVADALLLRFSSATPGATAADCACIAPCVAFTKATLRAR